MSDLYKKFLDFEAENDLFSDKKVIIAGLSGGVDSITMVDILSKYCNQKGIKLIAAHLNHELRGQKADDDENNVVEFCKSKNINLKIEKVNTREYSKKNNLSLEMAGRELRYNFFNNIAKSFEKSVIATAHTLNDHIETLLLRIIKGTGLNGMRGIPFKRDNIIRPLRFARKLELYKYAKENGINFSEDHTNFEELCQRNIIRNSMIPIISKINPGFLTALDNFSRITDEANQLIKNIAYSEIQKVIIEESQFHIVLDISLLNNYFTAVKKEIINKVSIRFNKFAESINFESMDRLLQQLKSHKSSKIIELNNGLIANIDRGKLVFVNKSASEWDNIIIEVGEKYKNNCFEFHCETGSKSEIENNKNNRNIEFIDLEKAQGKLILRHWKPGDKIKPLGFSNRKKLSDIFVDKKIPRLEKNIIPILESNGKIIWVCGLKLSDEFKVTDSTKNILKLVFKG